jgi:hypothetical protein
MASAQHFVLICFRACRNERCIANVGRCLSHVYTRVQTRHLLFDPVSCIRRLFLPNIIPQSICLSHISLMATSEYDDQAEIGASVHHSPGLESAIEDTSLQGSLSAVLNTSDETTRKRERLSTGQISGAMFHYFASIQNLMLPPVNVSVPTGRWMIPNSERSNETTRATTGIKDVVQQPQGAISMPKSEGPPGNMYPSPRSETPGPASIAAVVESHSPTPPGSPVEFPIVLISIPTDEYTASESSKESNSIPNTASCIGTSVQSSQKPSSKGRVQFDFVLPSKH